MGTSRPRATTLVAALIALGAGIGACGEDDPVATSTEATTTTRSVETPTTSTTSTTSTTTDQGDQGDDSGGGASGGTAPPLVPDEGHEGGGPDPGTGEGEAGDGGGGGQSPPDAFEEFCEQNPAACE